MKNKWKERTKELEGLLLFLFKYRVNMDKIFKNTESARIEYETKGKYSLFSYDITRIIRKLRKENKNGL